MIPKVIFKSILLNFQQMPVITLAITHRGETYFACLEKDQTNEKIKLFDKENKKEYESLVEFRNKWIRDPNLRNGQQISNIIILVDDEPIGKYSDFKTHNQKGQSVLNSLRKKVLEYCVSTSEQHDSQVDENEITELVNKLQKLTVHYSYTQKLDILKKIEATLLK